MAHRLTDRERAHRDMLEAELQSKVVTWAHRRGWKAVHFHPSMVADDSLGDPVWATAVSADAKGFPDLMLCRPGSPVIFAELKRELESRGKLSDLQEEWARTLIACGQVYVVWRPSDLPDIRRILK